ncbi:complex I subunit 5 family protein [Aestuariivirga sp.]|uniref:complex I subunit 5 family protein n=1 Tax=Aestuariivirga sp. TaxID=2650926 RepID=UPI00391881F8
MMPFASMAAEGATAGGFLLVLGIMLPAVAILALFVLGGRVAALAVALALAAQIVIALGILFLVGDTGQPIVYVVGGWVPPLGITLRADGISAIMLLTAGLVSAAAAAFAWRDYGPRAGEKERRSSLVFFSALLAIGSALNLLFTSADLFNLYVGLELLTFAAIPLVSLKGSAETIRAALRYLLFAVFGSMLYLLGVVLIYGAHGTLDIAALAARAKPEAVTLLAAGLATAGLLAKTALFPFHLWLPPAHAGAPPAASAVLSALVVKGSLFLLARLWFDAFPALREPAAMQLLAGLGAAAVILGSVSALRQVRLKLLVAYSTVAQIGYMFFIFTLVPSAPGEAWLSGTAWTGGWMQVVAHAFAKAAMFMAAGLVAEALGHDRIDALAGLARRLPLVALTFAVSGLSLMGIPPSGGFSAKWMLLVAALAQGHWIWAAVIIAGGVLAGAYVFRVLGRMMAEPPEGLAVKPLNMGQQAVALGLALVPVALGLLPLEPAALLQVGRAP